jgi:hypothetical protein
LSRSCRSKFERYQKVEWRSTFWHYPVRFDPNGRSQNDKTGDKPDMPTRRHNAELTTFLCAAAFVGRWLRA